MPSNTRPPRGGKSKPGPARTPAALVALRGGKARPTPPVPPEGEISPPAHLEGHALAEWMRLAPSLIKAGLLTTWDREIFSVFCEAVALKRDAADMLARDGVL